MTTRHAGYIVVLDDDIREDDAEYVINAIRMIKGVGGVTPVEADAASVIARQRVITDLRNRLYELARSLA